tara:strand:- start:815 stop:2044 length:1230 start_codon:yes stop_codon:yes gene_type:complete
MLKGKLKLKSNAGAPAGAVESQLYYDSSENTSKIYNGSTWKEWGNNWYANPLTDQLYFHWDFNDTNCHNDFDTDGTKLSNWQSDANDWDSDSVFIKNHPKASSSYQSLASGGWLLADPDHIKSGTVNGVTQKYYQFNEDSNWGGSPLWPASIGYNSVYGARNSGSDYYHHSYDVNAYKVQGTMTIIMWLKFGATNSADVNSSISYSYAGSPIWTGNGNPSTDASGGSNTTDFNSKTSAMFHASGSGSNMTNGRLAYGNIYGNSTSSTYWWYGTSSGATDWLDFSSITDWKDKFNMYTFVIGKSSNPFSTMYVNDDDHTVNMYHYNFYYDFLDQGFNRIECFGGAYRSRQNNNARNWASEAHHSARWTSASDDRNVLPAQCAQIMVYWDEVNQTERASIYNAYKDRFGTS